MGFKGCKLQSLELHAVGDVVFEFADGHADLAQVAQVSVLLFRHFGFPNLGRKGSERGQSYEIMFLG